VSETRSISGRKIEVKNLEKVFFPDAKITKGNVVDYYARFADRMQPVLKERALTLRRFPDGIAGDGFFQKAAADYFPDWIKTVVLDKEDGTIEQVVAEEPATLVYLADQGTIEFHAPLSRVDLPDKPDLMIFDLDPSDDYDDHVRQAALELRDLLAKAELPTFVKSTGSRGFHVVVPLERRHEFDSVRAFADGIAALLTERLPGELTTEQRKDKRQGRIFIDTQRNAYGQTAIAPYSLRARPEAPIACPLHWRELTDTRIHPRMVTLTSLERRLAQTEDPWVDLEARSVTLGEARRLLGFA
jgi:bifunctional non-homologous end joining protein LigD